MAFIDSAVDKVRVVDPSGTVVDTVEIPVIRNEMSVFSPVTAVYVNPVPDGLAFDPTDQILYDTGEPGDGSAYSIYQVRLDGTGRARLTPGLNIEQAPAVHP